MTELNRKKRVWHLIANPWNSAICEYALSSAAALNLVGFDNLFSPLEGSPAEKRALKKNLEVKAIKRFNLSALFHLWQIKSKYDPDFVFLYGGKESFLIRILKKISRKGRVIRFRGQVLKSRDLKYKYLFQWSHKHLDLVLSSGRFLLNNLQKVLKDTKVSYLPLGIDVQKFYLNASHLEEDLRRPKILIVGRLDPVKGHDNFLKLFSKILQAWPSTSTIKKPYLHIIGEEENIKLSFLETQMAEYKLSSNDVVIETKRVREISKEMSLATVAAIPSLWSEEICRVAEEFLLCGTAVIVSGVGALEDALFDDESGVSYKDIADKDRVALFIDWIHREFKAPHATRLKRAQKAKKYFSLETMGDNLSKILKEI